MLSSFHIIQNFKIVDIEIEEKLIRLEAECRAIKSTLKDYVAPDEYDWLKWSLDQDYHIWLRVLSFRASNPELNQRLLQEVALHRKTCEEQNIEIKPG